MEKQWEVIQNLGQWAQLHCNAERMDITAPEGMSKETFLEALPPGKLIDDAALKALMNK